MTKAASEPLYFSPLSERLGYLAHAINAIDIGSPDTLHGAAHYAPLTGLYLPILDLLAEYNDTVIEAGQSANIESLKCMSTATRALLVAEQTRLQSDDGTKVVEDTEGHDHIINELMWRGEATAANIALSCAPKEMKAPLSYQIRQLINFSSSGDEEKDALRKNIANEILQALDNDDAKTAKAKVTNLLQLLGLPSK